MATSVSHRWPKTLGPLGRTKDGTARRRDVIAIPSHRWVAASDVIADSVRPSEGSERRHRSCVQGDSLNQRRHGLSVPGDKARERRHRPSVPRDEAHERRSCPLRAKNVRERATSSLWRPMKASRRATSFRFRAT
jgi:hypothetical protein